MTHSIHNTHSQPKPFWDSVESDILIKADLKAQEMQKRIACAVRALFTATCFPTLFPQFAERVCAWKQFDPVAAAGRPKAVKESIEALKKGLNVEENLRALQANINSIVHTTSIPVLAEDVQILNLLIDFFADEKNHHLTLMPGVMSICMKPSPQRTPENNLNLLVLGLQSYRERPESELMDACFKELISHKGYLSFFEKYLESVAEDFTGVSHERKPYEIWFSDQIILDDLMESFEERRQLETSILDECEPADLLTKAREIINDGCLKSCSVPSRLQMLKTMAENDPTYGPYFKNKAIKLASKVLKFT